MGCLLLSILNSWVKTIITHLWFKHCPSSIFVLSANSQIQVVFFLTYSNRLTTWIYTIPYITLLPTLFLGYKTLLPLTVQNIPTSYAGMQNPPQNKYHQPLQLTLLSLKLPLAPVTYLCTLLFFRVFSYFIKTFVLQSPIQIPQLSFLLAERISSWSHPTTNVITS